MNCVGATCPSLVWWLWWLWCGPVCNVRMSVHAHARCNKLKRTSASASAQAPSAGLTSQKPLRLFPPKAGSRRPQVQTITQPQAEEKDCEARPPPTPSDEGSAIFSTSSALRAPDPE